jgi:hypothetical protein
MKKLNDIQVRILRALTFVEPFDTLVEEVPFPEPVIGAELKALISQRFVQAMSPDNKSGKYERSFVFDGDNLRAFSYIATSHGMDHL